MKTSHPTTRIDFLSSLMIVMVITTLAVALFGLQPVDDHTVTPRHPNSYEVPTRVIRSQKPDTLIRTDEGLPRAREDAVRTAISGSPGRGPGNGYGPAAPTDESDLKISNRASDANMLSFTRQTSLQQMASVYREASQMIDARHVSPPSYEDRTRGAIAGVIRAIRNETFLRVNQAQANPQAIQAVESQLVQIANSQPARDANEAVGVMQLTAELVSRSLGIRREAVAVEFMNGTLDHLDKYSAFLPESSGGRPGAAIEPYRTVGLEEHVVGIGVELKAHPEGVEIVSVIEGSPSEQLGLREGDLIVTVGQQPVGGRTLNEIADRLAGPAGSSVTIEVVRDGRKFRGTLVRRKFYVSSVTGAKMIDPAGQIGYLRMKQFSASSAQDLEKALWSLHNQGMKGLVLDLRGNPGGLLDVCIAVTDMFLPSGVIVSTKGPNASDNSTEMAKYEKTWGVPLVVLQDEYSASASEIFAAAVQDNRRGVIIGRNSYGKGTVQTHFPMRTVSATLKLTTAKFYAPSGREMAGQGVTPDVPVNAPASGTRGTVNDTDLQVAVQVFREGTPSNLAAMSGNGQAPRSIGQFYRQLGPTQNPQYPGQNPYGIPQQQPQQYQFPVQQGQPYQVGYPPLQMNPGYPGAGPNLNRNMFQARDPQVREY
ncbi:S41 family peptidase [Planctomicrobium sp. SH664]|uniref:S41 family peptidase n=1 Tax=Planctomicrobium sp. SH664 TaxID=3448125 RepID=UPI003F5C7E21